MRKAKRISELTELETSDDADLLVVVDVSESDINDKTKNQTKKNLLKEVHVKLDAIEDGAQVNTVNEVNGKTGDVVLDKNDIGLSNVDNLQQLPLSQKGANNGVATLDSGGKIPASQLPSTVMEYQGTWNATTNIPHVADGVGNAGDVYLVSVAGTVNLGHGNIKFNVGDWVVYSGSVWQKSINSNEVVSVNGQKGEVVLTTDEINEGEVSQYFTVERATGVVVAVVSDAFIKSTLGPASGGADGYLTKEDWGTFHGKQDALGFTPYNAENISSLIKNSVLFAGTGTIVQDPTDFTFDPSTNTLAIGATNGGNENINASLGVELAPALTGVTGGNWTYGAGYTTPLAGTIDKTADGTNTITPTAATTIVAGTTYKVVITTSSVGVAGFVYTLGGVGGTPVNTAGTITDYIHASTTAKMIIYPSPTTSRFTITSISIKAVTSNTGNLFVEGNLNVGSSIFTSGNSTGFGMLPIQTGQGVTIIGQVSNTTSILSSIPLVIMPSNNGAANPTLIGLSNSNNPVTGTSGGIGVTYSGVMLVNRDGSRTATFDRGGTILYGSGWLAYNTPGLTLSMLNFGTITSELPNGIIYNGNTKTITGSFANLRDTQFGQSTITAASALSISGYTSTFYIKGATIFAGSATTPISAGLYIDSGTSLTTGVAAGYGLYVNAPTGATANYAATFMGGNVGIGTASPNANALLDITSTTKAFMPPRMTTTQKNAIPSPKASMVVYDTDLGKLCVYTTAWQAVTSV